MTIRSMPDPLRVCIVAFNAYPAANPKSGGQVGGTETRAWLFARELAKRSDLAVSLAVRTTDNTPNPMIEEVRILSQRDRFYRLREAVGGFASRQPGFPWVRIHRWSPSLIWQIPLLASARLFEERPGDPRQPMSFFQTIEADVFCCFGNQATAATAIASAHSRGRPAVLFLGSDDDLNPSYRADSQVRNPYGDTGATCHFSLTQADAVFCQTAEQQMMLRDRFGREGVVIPNPIDLSEWDERTHQPLPSEYTGGLDRFVLWIGRAESIHKRPQVLLEIAKRCPEIPFLMVLNPRDPAVDATTRAEAPENVRIVTQVPFSLMPALFRLAMAYVNTSSLEGFPNAMLQAAASGVPIVSLEVGRDFLQTSGAGTYCSGNLNHAAVILRQLANGESDSQDQGRLGRRFVEQFHSLDAVIPQMTQALQQVAAHSIRNE